MKVHARLSSVECAGHFTAGAHTLSGMKKCESTAEVLRQNLARALHGRNKSEFARNAGLSVRTLYTIADGDAAPQIGTLDALASALERPAWQLLVPDLPEDIDPKQLCALLDAYITASPKGRALIKDAAALVDSAARGDAADLSA